jgi:D-alanyl-lipoteichoic acid acyltransferase DltB (MBOAT superfamily)
VIFTDPVFLAFFVPVLAAYWLLRGDRARKLLLLLSSYVFYGSWDWRFLGLLLFTTATDYTAGLLMARAGTQRARRAGLSLSVLGNLGVLFFFKYWDFFVTSGVQLLDVFGVRASPATLQLVLPVGLSFYTFQSLGYALDVYWKRVPAERDPFDFALFVAFFPQLVAGPISRAGDLLPQIRTPRRWADVDVRAALILFLTGFVKKACIADHFAVWVDTYWKDPAAYGPGAAWAAWIAYAIQFYCDFSGYSDMALGSAALLGYRLPLNFAHPYLAGNIAEFWSRWHITLSSWFRDYVLVPLSMMGRGTTARIYAKVLLTMLLVGLWHGAAWHFVLWGGVLGVLLLLHREWALRAARHPALAAAGRALGVPLTFTCVTTAAVLFRAPDLAQTWLHLRALAGVHDGAGGLVPPVFWPLVAALALAHLVTFRGWLRPALRALPAPAFAFGYGLLASLVPPFMAANRAPFLYFQF